MLNNAERLTDVIPEENIQWGLKKFLWSFQENKNFSPLDLGKMPQGSFGAALREYYRAAPSLPLPGADESLFPAEYLARHDCHHVLIGADTTAAGEVEVIAFECGVMSEQGARFFALLAQIQVFCEARGQYLFDASRAMVAFNQGVKVSQSLFEDWDFRSELLTPLAELRNRLGIQPLADIYG